ncbi:MAG: bifunctional DNA-binding transcriptional regulator/O6-methylguanine-DNA methyltransferase Ada [Asticcacaulis sp.]
MPDTNISFTPSSEADSRWQALLSRKGDGFVYGVSTTGIYCRPDCPSRLPKRENVVFFDTSETAETAGFRACLRCDPEGEGKAAEKGKIIAEACRLIEQSEAPPLLEGLAKASGLSPHHFHRTFKAATGLTPKAYADACRAARARGGLQSGQSVTDALYAAGFGSNGRFYERSNAILGMTPTRYRKGGAGEVIHFALGQSSLGAILVAQSDKGVCAITMGDDPESLVRDLQDRFPQAQLIGGDAGFEAVVAQVVGFVDVPAKGLDLPLDIRGTAFQQRVWQVLQAIPAGQTRSYAEIAALMSAPKAVRAVAGACAANALAVVIPCHRVVRTDGGLSGYRWGVDRKRALLLKEAQNHDPKP